MAPNHPASYPVLGVSDDELDIAYSGAAVFANKFYITISGPNARLSFTEQMTPTKTPKFRSAVVISLTDLVQMKNVLVEMCKDLQPIDIPPRNFDA